MSWTLVLQIILLTITLGFFLVLFGAVLMSYSTRKYEYMTKFYEASRSVDAIRAEVIADMYEAYEEEGKERDFVRKLFHGDEDGVKSG